MSFARRASVFAFLFAFFWQSAFAQLPDFTGLVESNNAAVVNISTTQKVAHSAEQEQRAEGPEGPEGVPFDDFLKRYFGEGGAGPQIPGFPPGLQQAPGGEPPAESMSLGSGFIISSDGYVITNHHVIKDADEVVVRLQDRRELTAKIIGSDKRSDIALIKLEATNLPVVRLGSSESLKVGEWVLAIGSPFGFDHSATAGIVSAKGRSLPSDNYVPFIQTDVAINPGNSGGPLFNLNGEVVGVNSQIYSRTGGFMGLSFAIPIDVAMTVVEQLKTQGKVTRGWLGVQIQDVTRELAESFGMKKAQGALVAKVMPDSPASAAGLQPGDIIEAFNDRDIPTSSALPPMVGATKIGEVAVLRIVRQGKPQRIEIKIGQLPDEDQLAQQGGGKDSADGGQLARFNVQIVTPTDSQRAQLDLPKTGGALITGVKPGPAADAGIRPGDLILRVQDQVIRDAKHLEDVVKTLPKDKSVALLVHRRGGSQFLALKLKD